MTTITVSTTAVQAKTVELTKAIVRQLDTTHDVKEGDEIIGRISGSVFPTSEDQSRDAILIKRKDEYLLLKRAQLNYSRWREVKKIVIL